VTEEDLDLMLATAKRTGIRLDDLYYLSVDLCPSCLAKLCGNVSMRPKYRKSKVNP